MKTETATVDVTPTWSGILPYLLVVLADGNAEGQRTARAELGRMAKLADLYVASQTPAAGGVA